MYVEITVHQCLLNGFTQSKRKPSHKEQQEAALQSGERQLLQLGTVHSQILEDVDILF
jgi:hypothetical protein